MKLVSILERCDYRVLQGSTDIDIADLVYDSRKAGPGSLFVCIAGANFDGHAYIAEVAEKGAAAVLAEAGRIREGTALPENLTVIVTDDTRKALACASAAWFGYPADRLKVIGITGTKGKTTTTYMIRSILEHAGWKTGLIGTIEAIIGETHIPSANTTPESYVIQKYLREMADAGCRAAVMEVSSQALMMHRTDGIEFEIGVFTNLSPDHIGPNEHGSFEEYLACKRLLFRQCRTGIFNADDPYTPSMEEGHTCSVLTYGIDHEADLRAEQIEHISWPGYLGVRFLLTGLLNGQAELDLPGKFSVYNALTAAACCAHLGIGMDSVRAALKDAKVKGRIEPVRVSDEFMLLIDYAHNAMALESLLTTMKDYNPGRLVCVFGCGGNRAKSRRYEMGEVSGRLADLSVITSDNPRFEEPEAIIEDILTGIRKTEGQYVTIPDRKEAIAYAIRNGQRGDVIILAGKGHEDYQEICGKKYPMDERVLIKEILDEEAVR